MDDKSLQLLTDQDRYSEIVSKVIRVHPEVAVVVGNLNLVRSLGLARIPVIAALPQANKIAGWSRYVAAELRIPGPTLNPVEFIESLVTLGECLQGRTAVLYYDGDADLACISKNRKRLEKYFRLNLPDMVTVEALLDKKKFYDMGSRAGLKLPKIFLLDCDTASDCQASNLEFPLIAKPIDRIGWFGTELSERMGVGAKAFRVSTEQELAKLRGQVGDSSKSFVLQELIEGPESEIFSYHAYIGRDGELLGEYTGRKVRTWPTQYGVSSYVEVSPSEEIIEKGREVIAQLNLIGILKLDFKRQAESGRIFLLEVNSRFNLWNYPASVAGANLPLIAFRYLCGKSPRPCGSGQALRVTRWRDGHLDRPSFGPVFGYLKDLVSHLGRDEVYNLWAWCDPVPFFAQTLFRVRRKLVSIFSG